MFSIYSTFILWIEHKCRSEVQIPVLHPLSILRPLVFFANIALGNNKLSLNSNCSKLTFSIIH